MSNYPWKWKGVVLTAPLRGDLDAVCELIEKKLAPAGVNLVVIQTRYRYEFKSHPECIGNEPLSEADVKQLLRVCRENGIRLVPKMNLFAHQSGRLNGPRDGILHGYREDMDLFPHMADGLLRAYPEFNETPDVDLRTAGETFCLCPSHPDCARVVCDLTDELLDVYEADALHIGCDEAFDIGLCPRCRGKDKAKLYADWVRMLSDHLAKRGAKVLMWGDRLLGADTSGYNDCCESSAVGTEAALGMIPKDIILCDWHYGLCDAYRSVDLFAEAGFRMFFSPWRIPENALAFYRYAKEHDRGHILGLLATSWCSSGELARAVLYGQPPRWDKTQAVVDAWNEIVFKNP